MPLGVQISDIPEVVLALATIIAIASVLAIFTRRVGIPLSLILVVVGFVAGELARANDIELPIEGESFEQVLVFVFLPALVFAAALELPARVFWRNLAPIVALAVWALAISAAIVGIAVHFGVGISLLAAFLFGALISATDPVAVTAVFRELGVPQRLLVLVEGESLLNDGVAIVLFNILLVAALGTEDVSALQGVADFVLVALGGVTLGAVLGLLAAEITPRLGRMPSTALTIALAYGSFVLSEEILEFSGVMATVSAGIVLSSLGGTLIPRQDWETWGTVWEAIGFTANGVLFVLIGVILDIDLITDHAGAIAVAVAAVLIARPLAILPSMPVVTRLAGIPRVGRRNEAVLVWGGLRGGVALALALAIPEQLPERDEIVAMTGAVVITTLAVNATTISPLIRRLGLDRPDRLSQWVAAAARWEGAHSARGDLGHDVPSAEVASQLSEIEQAAAAEIHRLALHPDEIRTALIRRGLAVERATFQGHTDHGLLPQWHGRVILQTLDDLVDDLQVGQDIEGRDIFEIHGLRSVVYRVARLIHSGRITADQWVELVYRDLNSRHLAAHAAMTALARFGHCPGVDPGAAQGAHAVFERWHRAALETIESFTRSSPEPLIRDARRRYAVDLAAVDAERELEHLATLGLISPVSVDAAGQAIRDQLAAREHTLRGRIAIEVDEDEDVGI